MTMLTLQEQNLNAALSWLQGAYQAVDGNGLSSHYNLKDGWAPAYPEVSGYIIVTLLQAYRQLGDKKFLDMAIGAADWECRIQMECGAWQGGLINEKPHPVVFNTGMVLLGLADIYEITKDEKYRKSAARAADWLVSIQDEDGPWRKWLTLRGSGPTHLYHTRVDWGILRVWQITGDDRYKRAVIKHLDWAMTQQISNGWYEETDLRIEKKEEPLLHFLSYTIDGILECADILKSEKYMQSSKLAADALLASQREDGFLAGRWNRQWKPTVEWCCVTAVAQMGIVWLRFYQITGEDQYLRGADKAIAYLSSIQPMDKDYKGIYGGLPGSYPVDGGYEANNYLSWAVKFFGDLLLLRRSIR